jgi:hypothetical protein
MAMRWLLHHFDCCCATVNHTVCGEKARLVTTGVIVKGGQTKRHYSNFDTKMKVL